MGTFTQMTTGSGDGAAVGSPAGTGTDAAAFYTGIVPHVYAALRSATFDAAPYLDFVHRVGEPALELGCGDDGPFLELARRGVDIDGVDSSADMLERCQARAAAAGLKVATYRQAMQDLDLPRCYRSVYLAGPTFNLLPDDETAGRALVHVARHLEQGGEVMVPLWIPSATPVADFGQTKKTTTADGATARYTVEAEDFDDRQRTRRTRTRYELVRQDGTEIVRRDWIIHWHTPDGFAVLARTAGLEVLRTSPVQDGEFVCYLGKA
jgi:trans-aconitate methyltransferase